MRLITCLFVFLIDFSPDFWFLRFSSLRLQKRFFTHVLRLHSLITFCQLSGVSKKRPTNSSQKHNSFAYRIPNTFQVHVVHTYYSIQSLRLVTFKECATMHFSWQAVFLFVLFCLWENRTCFSVTVMNIGMHMYVADNGIYMHVAKRYLIKH